MKKTAALILIAMLLSSCGICAAESENSWKLSGFDATEYRSWGENNFFLNMEEATGVHFELTQYTDASEWKKAKASMKQGEELPDVLFKAQLTAGECMEMLEKGVLVDLAPYLETCCPNFMKLAEKYPEYMRAITLPSGQIAALPYINETPSQNILWINKKFLSAVRMDVPQTIEDLEKTLRAFKTYDVNANGNANDEIPLGYLGPFDLKFVAHAWGIICNDYNIAVRDGRVCFLTEMETFPEFIQWCAKMYREQLLDKNGFSTTDAFRTVTDDKTAQVYGVLITPMVTSILPASWLDDYTAIMPFMYEGKQIYRDYGAGLIRGTFAVTSACTDVEAMLRWVDYLYSEEGSTLESVGKKGVDYVVDGDGSWRLTEAASSDTYHTVSDTISSSAAAPGYSADDFQRRFSNASLAAMLDTVKEFNQYCVLPFPYTNLTEKEYEYITPLQNSIAYETDMRIAQWILGEEAFSDESLEALNRSLHEKGLDDFIGFWQKVYDSIGG